MPSARREIYVEPETFDDSQSIADYIRDRKPVVINFESTPDDIAKRVVDFVSGATYALDGNIQKVGKEIFLCVPSNVTVDHGKRDDYGADAQITMNVYNHIAEKSHVENEMSKMNLPETVPAVV